MSDKKTLEEFTTAYKEENPDATDDVITTAFEAYQLEGLNLTDKVIQVMDDYGKMLMEQMKATLQKQMDSVIKSTQDELVAAIRKGVGLEEDPVIHLSEVSGLVRKMLLEKEAGAGKITTDNPGAGPDGSEKPVEKLFDLDKSFNEAMKGRTL